MIPQSSSVSISESNSKGKVVQCSCCFQEKWALYINLSTGTKTTTPSLQIKFQKKSIPRFIHLPSSLGPQSLLWD